MVSAAVLRCISSPAWPSVEEPAAYLYCAVLNQARSVHRSAMRRTAREVKAAGPLIATDPEPQPDAWNAVRRLSLRQRAVTMLTYADDLTVAEGAGRLGISEGAVHRHLARARTHLRKALQ